MKLTTPILLTGLLISISSLLFAKSNGLPETAIISSETGIESPANTVNVSIEVTAGNLKTVLAGQLSTTTSLTLTGTIDARDFKTMRDQMPALTDIDLSDVTILDYTGTEGTCPSTWGSTNYPSNEIPQNAFNNLSTGQHKKHLTSFIFPLSVNSIGSGAFSDCSGLASVLIPSLVATIGNNAFSGCNALFSVDANNANFSALDGILFNKGQIELIRCPISKTGNYTIPSSVTSIGNYAFYGCNQLTDVRIPSSVTSIGGSAFFDCTGLTEITIPSSIQYIGGQAFGYSLFLTSIKVKWFTPLNISSSPQVFQEVNSSTCTLHVPFGSKIVYQAAYQWNDFTNIVEMPGILLSSNTLDMNSIAGTAHVNLSSNINWTATSDQSWLSIYPVSGTAGSNQPITFTVSKNPTWVNRTATVTISALGIESQTITVTQKDNTEVTAGELKNLLTGQLNTITKLKLTGTIDARDFKTMRDEMPALTEIDLSGVTIVEYIGPEGTTDIGSHTYPANTVPSHAFQNNMNITTLIIPSSAISIESYAFFNCVGLKTIPIPSSVTTIEEGVFEHCRDLTSVTIPSSVNTIENLVFSGSTWINVDTNNPKYSSIDGILFNKTQSELIFCPVSKKGNYTIPSSVTSIGMYAFNDCIDLSTVIIPSSVISIGRNAFDNCSGLSIGTIPASVTSIGGQAFVRCYGLINVDENNLNYSSIDGILFNKSHTILMQCPLSKSGNYTIPSSVTTIGYEAFAFCKELTTITIPASVVSIETSAFSYCSGLNSIYTKSISPINLNSSDYVFYTINTKAILHVPFGLKADYQQATQWRDFTNIVENIPPIANAGTDQSIDENKLFTLDGSASSDADNDGLTYLWTAPAGITLSSNSALNPTFIAPEVTTDTNYTLSLTVNDSWMNSTVDQVVVTVKQVNKAPIANAGIDQSINENKLFTLDASASSDSDNDALNYLWTAPAGITLSSNNTSNPSFLAPEVTTDTNYSFSLTVNDGLLNSTADQVVVTVKQVNKAPSANAGADQSINENSPSNLDGSASSDPDNDALTYLWTAPDGITLSSNTASQPTFIAPEVKKDTNYTFSLTVSDGRINSTVDEVIVTVKQVNKAPFANAGTDGKVTERKIYQLDGRQSFDLDNDQITYQWTAPEGIELNSTKVSNPTFTAPDADTNTNFTFRLVVNDGHVDSPADQVVVTVTPNKAPIANISFGNITLTEHTSFILDGSASSDPDNDELTYLWTAPKEIILSSNTVSKPTFLAPEVNTNTNYIISLLVNDGSLNSEVKQIEISVINVDNAPYVKNPINNISVDKTAPDQIIDLQTVFADVDLGDVLSYSVRSNSNDQVVLAKITGCNLTLSFSSENIGSSEIEIVANSNGKEVNSKFNVEVKIPTTIDPLVGDQKLRAFPNPTNGKVKVEFDQIPAIGNELIVTDINGKMILKQAIHDKEEWVDLTGNMPGLYLLKTSQGDMQVQKLLLK